MLRPYFKHNKKVFSEIARLVNDMIVAYYNQITGKKIRTGVVLAFQSFGDFLRSNLHYHALILDGGFDENGNFIHIPILDLTEMKECFRRLVINYFKNTGLLSEKMAQNLLSWKHSGFNIDNSIRIMGHDNKARESLAQYIARCPISLKKIIYEPFKDKVIFKTKYNAYFKENVKLYDPIEFIALAAQHIPVLRVRLIRYFGFYSSKSRGKWQEWDHVKKHAPLGWREQNGLEKELEDNDELDDTCDVDDVSHKKSKASWARLIVKIYEVDPMICDKCGSEMKILAIITSEYEIKKILRHLVITGKSPPSVDESLLKN
ncbi:MAG: transposase [Spirochaetota bacterium]|nr:transposase [Spirochaetota bacterium]